MIGKYVLYRMTGTVKGKRTFRIIVVVPQMYGPSKTSMTGDATRLAEEWQQLYHPGVPAATWTAYPRPAMGDPLETIYGRVDI